MIYILSILLQIGYANSVDWSGTYRFESNYVKSANLDDDSNNYFLHHLVLKPKIIAADNLHIHGRFDLLNNEDTKYENTNNQLGSFLGDSPYDGSLPVDTTNSKTLNSSQEVSYLSVSHLYLRWIHEYGSLIVGRAPKDFGLGLSYSAGNGMFDHWMDTHDVVSYQFLIGNTVVQPIYAKVEEGAVNKNNEDTQEVGLKFFYENPETDLKMGAYYEERKNSAGIENDGSTPVFGGDPAKTWSSYKHKNWNLFVSKKYDQFGFAMELGFNAGTTGVLDTNGDKISIDAFAVITELFYQFNETWKLDLKAGMVTGDDASTTDTFEGYIANRNYQVGMLLFNHPLGKLNVLNTNYSTSYTSADVDSERLSNAIYFAPGFEYNFSDKWSLRSRFIYANLMEEPRAATDADKSLGMELDLGLSYHPFDRFEVKLDTAYLSPGDAFKGGTNNYSTDSIYGFNVGIGVHF